MAWWERIKTEWSLPLIGFLQGLALYLLSDTFRTMLPVIRDGLVVAVMAAPLLLMLTSSTNQWRRPLLTSAAFAAAVWGLGYGLTATVGPFDAIGSVAFGFVASVFLFTAALAMWLGEPAGDKDSRYARRFDRLLDLFISVFVASVFLGVLWLILIAWGALFRILEISFFAELFGKDYFGWCFSGTAFGLGLAVLRGLPGVVLATRRLVIAVLRIFAAVLTVMGVLFLLALWWRGLAPLIRTGADAEILIWVMLLSILFINGVAADGRTDTAAAGWQKRLVIGLVAVLPLYAGVGLYCLWLRYHADGLTVDRVYGFALAGVGLVMSLFYAASTAKSDQWTARLIRVNPYLWRLVLVAALVLHLPFFNAATLTAANQAARLKSGAAVSLQSLGALKFDYGKPGQRAYEALIINPDFTARPGVQAVVDELSPLKDRDAWLRKIYGAPNLPQPGEPLLSPEDLDVYPAGAALPPDFTQAAASMAADTATSCGQQWNGKVRCAAIILDVTGDGVDDVALWNAYAVIDVFSQADSKWRLVRKLVADTPVDPATLRPALAAGRLEAVAPQSNDLQIGNIRFE